MSLAAEIAHWYQTVFTPAWGHVYAVVGIPAHSPYAPSVVSPAANSREEAIAAMRLAPRPTSPGWFLAVVGPWGIEATRA